ncbi:MAG: hypothetical protein GY861_28790 [bacterium]|nr:hypothetical protein [bacterium]
MSEGKPFVSVTSTVIFAMFGNTVTIQVVACDTFTTPISTTKAPSSGLVVVNVHGTVSLR